MPAADDDDSAGVEALGIERSDGVAASWPSPGGAPANTVLLHGFTQTGRCWAPVTRLMAATAVTVDLPGHGRSATVRADLWEGAELVAGAVEACGDGPVTLVGYSLGARVALHVALARPDVVGRLVLISGTAGIDDPSERARRRRADEALAARLESIGVERFVDEWLALPLFAGIPLGRTCRAERLANTTQGLASSLRLCGTGTQDPLWDELPRLAGLPVLVVTGAEDPKFTALGARAAATIGPSARHVVLRGCGHTPPLERPDAVARLLSGSEPPAPRVSGPEVPPT